MTIKKRLEKLERGRGAQGPADAHIAMTDQERAAALAAIFAKAHNSERRSLPGWFLMLPAKEQLLRWEAALARGDYEPAGPAEAGDRSDGPAPDGEAEGGPGLNLNHLASGLKEPSRDEDNAPEVDDDVGSLF
jgi:hypothetical protein